MTLPKPVIFTLSEFMVPGVKKELSKIVTSFPSQLKTLEGNKTYVEGGMILLRLDKASIRNENVMKFEINYYNELDNKKENIDIEYLFYFAKFNRRFMKICNNENKKKKYDKEYIKRKEFLDEKESIKKFMNEHLSSEKSDKLNEELVKEYLDNMEKNVGNAIKQFDEKKNEKRLLPKKRMVCGYLIDINN